MPKSPPVLFCPGSLKKATISLPTPLTSELSEPVVQVQPCNQSAFVLVCSWCINTLSVQLPWSTANNYLGLQGGFLFATDGIQCSIWANTHATEYGDMHFNEGMLFKN